MAGAIFPAVAKCLCILLFWLLLSLGWSFPGFLCDVEINSLEEFQQNLPVCGKSLHISIFFLIWGCWYRVAVCNSKEINTLISEPLNYSCSCISNSSSLPSSVGWILGLPACVVLSFDLKWHCRSLLLRVLHCDPRLEGTLKHFVVTDCSVPVPFAFGPVAHTFRN